MKLATLALVPILLLVPPTLALDPAPAWSNAASPGGGPVQGIGGSSVVLVASTWSNGAYESRDGGRHWVPIEGFPDVTEARVQFDLSDPLVGYVYGFGGVARTLDGGATWDHVLVTGVSSRLAVSPSGAVAASFRDDDWGTHVLVSRDRGDTWTDIAAPIPPFSSLYGLAFGHTDADVVAMSISALWATHDGGASWTTSGHDLLDLRRAPDGTLWGGGFSMRRSVDDGRTWQEAGAPANGFPLAIGADGRVFVPTSAGVLTSADAGATWQDLGSPGLAFGATSLLVDPKDPGAVFVSDEFLGITRVSAGGAESRATGLQPIEFLALAAAADGSVLLAGGAQGIFASRDEGATWSHTGAGAGFIGVFSVAASDDGSVLYGGGRTRVFSPFLVASVDRGATWDVFLPNVGGDGFIAGIAVDPADARHAFAAASMDLASSKLLETTDGGDVWNVVLDLPILFHDVAWDAGSGRPILATELGTLAYERPDLAIPRGATLDTATVAAVGARSWSSGPQASVWAGAAGAPHLPWADTGTLVRDLSPEDDASVWASDVGGALWRCAQLACEDVSPPAATHASIASRGAAYAATERGIYRALL
ncbi:MAG TPA: hypothetical protein VM370_01045 [Candidatus Thermoplasmatota archaeon]|nr:hypothetical protein [Candidatus Thermoplasmatota archaeon]